MGFKCGIVGLPNVGKSTLFNALTATAAAEAANYPFCTIEPNIGRVAVPDPRLFEVAAIAQSAQIIPTQLEFVDIAGLVRGASAGEGLGNQFLGHIREVDAILHVLRCFEDDDITHVEGSVDPIRDLETVETELMLADLESLEKRLSQAKKNKTILPDQEISHDLMRQAYELLKEGKPARLLTVPVEYEPIFKQLQLLTSKPILYVCNVSEQDASTGNAYSNQVAQTIQTPTVMISAAIESEIARLTAKEEREEFLQSLGLKEPGLAVVIRAGYKLLNLITFFTVGPKEARAWTVLQGSKAPQAAGVIHTDFERGFICAETIGYEDYLTYKGESGAKAAGKMRQEGRDYKVKDGDVFHFRFNV